MKLKVSFDFDGTLATEEVQQYAKELIERGVEVWVVTTRYDANHTHKYYLHFSGQKWIDDIKELPDPNQDLWEVVDKLGIPKHKVRFTCMSYKHHYLHETTFLWHLDDNEEELVQARIHGCSVPMISVFRDWKEQCEKLLKPSEDEVETRA